MQTYNKPSNSTYFPDLVTQYNAIVDTLRSNFSGSTQPSNPVPGQFWYDTTSKILSQWRINTLTGVGEWVNISPQSLIDEIETARGSTATLDARLSVGINADGTFKEAIPLTANTWVTETATVTFIDTTHFRVVGDVTAVYTVDRALNITQTSPAVMYVAGTQLTSSPTTTIVEVKEGAVDSGISQVDYSTLVKVNQPYTNVDVSGKANLSLDNLDATGEAKFTAKANVVSPTFTGTPTAPTPANVDNSTTLATTAFVRNLLNNVVLPPNRSSVTSITTLGSVGGTYKATSNGWFHVHMIGGNPNAYQAFSIGSVLYTVGSSFYDSTQERTTFEVYLQSGTVITCTAASNISYITRQFIPCISL